MSEQRKQPSRNPNRPDARAGGIPSCLWVVLGAVTLAVLLGVGLLLALLPASREASSPAAQAVETATYTPPPGPTSSPTPCIDQGSAPGLAGTTTPQGTAPGDELDLSYLLLATPAAEAGLVSVSPYLTADASNFLLEPGEPVIVRWGDFPPDALRYYLLLQPQDGGSYQTIGVDSDPADGVWVEWIVPENVAGDLSGLAIFPDGSIQATLVFGSIYSGTGSVEAQAAEALKGFFQALSVDEYQYAASVYAGEYALLEEYNPDLDPADRAGLLQRACQVNGFVCYPVHQVLSILPGPSSTYQITVNFLAEDGSPLELSGCCGESATDEPQTTFTFRVAKNAQGRFVVLDLPVYMP